MRGNSLLIILLVVIILLLVMLFIWWRMFFGFRGGDVSEEIIPENSTSEPMKPSASKKVTIDPALVGTWESDCLVPDAGSPWSEKHQFIINADGTARHTRWSSDGHACAPETTMVDKYKINTPSSGKIELTTLEGVGPSEDIYQVSGNTLLFGHGFRNDLPYAKNTLNQYIVYKKKN